MKPNDTILNTDFYQLANDGEVEVTLNIASGTSADYWQMAIFATQEFSVGSALADYGILIYDSNTSKWSATASKIIYPNMETVVDGQSGGVYPGMAEIKVYRISGNTFKLEFAVTGLGGAFGDERPSIMFYLRENLQIKLKVKTFLQPEIAQ